MRNTSLRSAYDLLPIGTRVSYHHRAGVARVMDLHKRPVGYSYYGNEEIKRGWKIVEGTLVYNGRNPETVKLGTPGNFIDGGYMNHNSVREMFFTWPQAKFVKYKHEGRYTYTAYNKTVMVWPDDGFGWIMGIMKKSIGESSRSYGNGEDYEQGWHQTDMYVDLYVLKPWYEGTQYILCPLWAVREVKDD